MRPNARTFRSLSMLGLLILTGCGGKGCSGTPASSPQGQRLKALLAEKREIVPQAPPDVPITFKAIEIESKGEGDQERLFSWLPWQLTVDHKGLRDFLEGKVRAKRPDLLAGQVTQFSLLLSYRGNNGEDCGSEALSIPVSDLRSRTALTKLCEKDGPLPHSASAELVAITWRENDVALPFRPGQGATTAAKDNRIMPAAPAALPLRFGEVTLDPQDPNFKKPPTLDWQLTANNATLHRHLLTVTEKGPSVSGLPVKSLTFHVIGKDQQGQPLSSDTVVLQVGVNGGKVALPNLTDRARLGSMTIEPVSATWQGRSESVSMR